ncbi:hypothetical protein M413DRAFT_18039 [Hebeloma cylindrosporum]|uniref:Uncharacterized protein n=1 Tax=Hebeloma cylindrosporum TaxID=76867 RepID=A0A0C2Y138_HEBCY|nr:hypothetical protein M413DRAFT_18039 [Hebeloma cylindrosporum h7]
MSYFVPLEIVADIVLDVLEHEFVPIGTYKIPGKNLKPSWSLIESLTLASRTFRQVALERWFRTLYIKSFTDLEYIDLMFPYLKAQWCRHLHCVQLDPSAICAWNLAGFKRLTSVRIDWFPINFTPTYNSPHIGSAFINMECPVKTVEVTGLRYPTPMSLNAFTAPFPHMTTLELESLRTWCGLCHTCTLVRFSFPTPTGFVYEGGLGLPVHYARILFSLESLQEVTITLPVIGSGAPSPGLSASANDNLWVGECDRCMSLMYEDDAFKNSWVERKRGITPMNVDEKLVYVRPPNLKKVQWKFWEFDPSKGPSEYSKEEVASDADLETEYPEDGGEGDGEEDEFEGPGIV